MAPEARRAGVARALLARGQCWMRDRGLARAATATATGNGKLRGLFEQAGYAVVLTEGEMVRLERFLS